MACPSNLAWNVYIGNFNSRRIEIYNIFDHGMFYDEITAAARKCKDTEREKFEEEVRRSLMYYFWSKCEWEIILDHWPSGEGFHDLKVDVYDQVRLNWGAFLDYLWENRAVLRKKRKVKSDRKALDGKRTQ